MLLSETLQGAGLFSYASLIILFPFLGLLINLTVGRRLGEKGVSLVASTAILLAFVIAVLQLLALLGQPIPVGATVPIAKWITVGDFSVSWSMQIDTL